MKKVTISSKYQVVIPREIREAMKLVPGQKLRISILDGSIRLSVPRPIASLRGVAKGLIWKDSYRDRNDRY